MGASVAPCSQLVRHQSSRLPHLPSLANSNEMVLQRKPIKLLSRVFDSFYKKFAIVSLFVTVVGTGIAGAQMYDIAIWYRQKVRENAQLAAENAAAGAVKNSIAGDSQSQLPSG